MPQEVAAWKGHAGMSRAVSLVLPPPPGMRLTVNDIAPKGQCGTEAPDQAGTPEPPTKSAWTVVPAEPTDEFGRHLLEGAVVLNDSILEAYPFG